MARAQTPARQLGIGGPHPLADDALPWLAIEVARVLRAHMPQAATRTLTLTLTLTPTRTLTRTRTLTLTLTPTRTLTRSRTRTLTLNLTANPNRNPNPHMPQAAQWACAPPPSEASLQRLMHGAAARLARPPPAGGSGEAPRRPAVGDRSS